MFSDHLKIKERLRLRKDFKIENDPVRETIIITDLKGKQRFTITYELLLKYFLNIDIEKIEYED